MEDHSVRNGNEMRATQTLQMKLGNVPNAFKDNRHLPWDLPLRRGPLGC